MRLRLPGARPALHKLFQVLHQGIPAINLLALSLATGFGDEKRSMEEKETVFSNVTISRLGTFRQRVAQQRP